MMIFLGTIYIDNGLYEGYEIKKLVYAKDKKEAEDKIRYFAKINYPGSTADVDDMII